LINLRTKLRAYWTLIKSLQTGLLLITGLAGYMSARCPVTTWQTLAGVAASLFLAIGGSTVLNMVLDRDIDLKMARTCQRPLPSGAISVREATFLGLALAVTGVGWAFALQPLYGSIVLSGLLFDVVVYTAWLKRRTAWSIVWGGIAGGMPILAGRALGIGQIDLIGLLLSVAVLLWIPTHIMTFSIRHQHDYRAAGVPTFPSAYGVPATRLIITLSSMAAAVAVFLASVLLGMNGGYLRLLGVLTAGLLGLAAACMFRPSERMNFGLFKYASMYMLSSMLLIAGIAA
jgi:protoheme IX farnesyltransferase